MFYKTENLIATIDYIEENLLEDLNLDIVANAVHYSKYHLHRNFTALVGFTLHDYIQRRKLTEAAKLLVFSNKDIIEIALSAGYKSQQAFSLIFKSMYKKSPLQYRKEKNFYPLQLKYVIKNVNIELNTLSELKNQIEFANLEDISLWMDLIKSVIDGFPNLQEQEYLKQLHKCIIEKKALILKVKDLVIAGMIVNSETGSIDFFGIDQQYRDLDIAIAFLEKISEELIINTDISITTFREGDKADMGHRKMLKNLGFTEAELLVEFGYPTQKFILHERKGKDNE